MDKPERYRIVYKPISLSKGKNVESEKFLHGHAPQTEKNQFLRFADFVKTEILIKSDCSVDRQVLFSTTNTA